MKHNNTISIIIPTKNNEEHIQDLLESIFSQTIDSRIETIILDSSDDQTPDIVMNLSEIFDIKLYRVEPEDYNYGGTRNLGASYSSGNFLVFISTDIEIKDLEWLSKLYSNFSDERVAGVYGRQIPKEDVSPMEEFFIKYTYSNHKREYDLSEKGYVENYFFSNTNSMIRKQVWEQIPLPEMLKSEDQEWGKRALIAGYKIIYDPETMVYHSHKYTLKQVFKEYFDSGATLPYVLNSKYIKSESFISKGFDYEKKQIKYFINNEYTKYLPYAFLYDFMKFLGYYLGTKCLYMPLWLRKWLTKKSNHWDKNNNIIKVHNICAQ